METLHSHLTPIIAASALSSGWFGKLSFPDGPVPEECKQALEGMNVFMGTPFGEADWECWLSEKAASDKVARTLGFKVKDETDVSNPCLRDVGMWLANCYEHLSWTSVWGELPARTKGDLSCLVDEAIHQTLVMPQFRGCRL